MTAQEPPLPSFAEVAAEEPADSVAQEHDALALDPVDGVEQDPVTDAGLPLHAGETPDHRPTSPSLGGMLGLGLTAPDH